MSTRLAGGTPVSLPMPADSGFQPDLGAAPVSGRTKALWLNFPSNPTAAVADASTFETSVAFAREHDLLLLHDAAYSRDHVRRVRRPVGAAGPRRQGRGARVRLGLEVLQHDRVADRLGGGSAEAIRALGDREDEPRLRAVHRDPARGDRRARGPAEHLDELRATYQRRRDLVVETLNGLGWDVKPPLGSCYVWVPVPEGDTSMAFSDRLLDARRRLRRAGSGYGAGGEGYVRFSLTVPDDRLAEAMDRLVRALA